MSTYQTSPFYKAMQQQLPKMAWCCKSTLWVKDTALARSSALRLLGATATHITTVTPLCPQPLPWLERGTSSLWFDYASSLTEKSKTGLAFPLCSLLGCQINKNNKRKTDGTLKHKTTWFCTLSCYDRRYRPCLDYTSTKGLFNSELPTSSRLLSHCLQQPLYKD